MTGYTPKNFGKSFGAKTFDHGSSHPRPELRPAQSHPNPYAGKSFAEPELANPEFGPITPAATPKPVDPQTLQTQDLPPHHMEAQTWAPKPATQHDPSQTPKYDFNNTTAPDQAEGFVSADDLLREMGLSPLKTPKATHDHKHISDAPFVEQHSTKNAEFSPPRPVRRSPTVFAHLKDNTSD